MVIAWLRYGLDLPYRDDWREYLSGKIATLNFFHLWRADNDTLSVTTRVLDAMAQRFLDGNSVAYQFLTMVAVLGALLMLQWKLLRQVLPPLPAACAFVATLLMLQPDSYWGLQNLAYIQAIPLVCLLAMLAVALHPRLSTLARSFAAFLLAMFAGLTYISGAVATAAMGFALAIICFLRPEVRKRLAWPSAGIMAGGLATSLVQLRVILVVQHGHTHRADAPWALPTDADFWLYLLGKVARSLMLPADMPELSLAITVALMVVACALACVLLFRRAAGAASEPTPERMGGIILSALLASVAVYLFMVAAGRANLRPQQVDQSLEIFRFGFARFHFFWATALWPWVVAGMLLLGRNYGTPPRRALLVGMLALGLSAYALGQGAGRHMQAFRQIEAQRFATDATCLRDALMTKRTIVCRKMAPYGDLTPAYRYAVRNGASFVRYFPPQLLAGNPKAGGEPINLLRQLPNAGQIFNAKLQASTTNSLHLSAGRDPQLVFSSGAGQLLGGCILLRVDATIDAASHDTAQFFYQVPGDRSFSEAKSRKHTLRGHGPATVTFVVENRGGFVDKLRLDPVANYQPATITALTMRCLL
jgi:hypothetical protein